MTLRCCVLALVILAATAHADSGRPSLWIGVKATSGPGLVEVPVGARKLRVRMLERVEPSAVRLRPHKYDDSRFIVIVALPSFPKDAWPYLELDGTWWSAFGASHGDHGGGANFEVDRGTAIAIARAHNVAIEKR